MSLGRQSCMCASVCACAHSIESNEESIQEAMVELDWVSCPVSPSPLPRARTPPLLTTHHEGHYLAWFSLYCSPIVAQIPISGPFAAIFQNFHTRGMVDLGHHGTQHAFTVCPFSFHGTNTHCHGSGATLPGLKVYYFKTNV